MNSDKKYFLLGIVSTILFGILVNVITPYFEKNTIAWIILLIGVTIFMVRVFNQEILFWFTKRSSLNKQKRLNEVRFQLDEFNKLCAELDGNTNKFIVFLVKNYLINLLVLLFLLFSRISIVAIPSILFGQADIIDYYQGLEAFIIFVLIVIYSINTSNGWTFIQRVVDLERRERYTKRLQKQIDWLASRVDNAHVS